ncbi:MAG: SpoIIE family protein phosphatase [Planctomycetes bacterium]|nr:SpoIIE family protein phosphatase [Planctomycetota bacterium]
MPERAVDRKKPNRPQEPALAPAPPSLPKLPDPKYCSRCQHFVLSEVTPRLHGAPGSQEIFALVLDAALRISGADRGFFLKLDGPAARPEPRLGRSSAGRDLSSAQLHPAGPRVAEAALRLGRPHAVLDLREADPHPAKLATPPEATTGSTGSSAGKARWGVGAPLLVPGDDAPRALGALYLDGRLAPPDDLAASLDVVGALCAAAAVPLERALLLERLQREKDRLASVVKLAAAVHSATDVTGLLRVGLDVIIKETISHRGFVMLLEGDPRRPFDRRLRFRIGSDREGNPLGEESFSIHQRHLEDVVRSGQSLFESPAEGEVPLNYTDTVMAFRATFPTFLPLKVIEHTEEIEGVPSSSAPAAPAPTTAPAPAQRPSPAATPSGASRADGRTIGVICVDSYVDTGESAKENLALLETLASQLALAVEKFRLRQLRLEKDRIDHDLRDAEKVQKFLLPRSLPALPGLNFGARCIPAHGPGGDYYDFVDLGPDKLAIAMADVSGHGVSASLITCLCRGILHQCCEEESSPAAILQRANRRLKQDLPVGMFVSFFLGTLDTDSLAFTYCNAGLPHPLFHRAGEASPALLRVGGMPLGIVRSGRYEEETLRLRPGDGLLVYTDGAAEAESRDGARFGTSSLMNLLKQNSGHAAQDLVGAIHAALVSHVGDVRLEDDVTMVALRVQAGVQRLAFDFASTEDELRGAVDRILDFLRGQGCVSEREADARLVFTELLANAVEHGNRKVAERKVRVRLRGDGQRAEVTVRDEGSGYDVESVWDSVQATDAAAERGRGLFLVARQVPNCRVSRAGNEILVPLQKGMF